MAILRILPHRIIMGFRHLEESQRHAKLGNRNFNMLQLTRNSNLNSFKLHINHYRQLSPL